MDYQKEYLIKNPNMHLEDSLQKVRQAELVIPPKIKVDSLLDVACGAGMITIEMAKRLKTSNNVGIDISRMMINKAKELDKSKLIDWRVSDIFKYNPKNKFDVVLCMDILEHVKDDLMFLKKVSSLGKYILIKTPLEKSTFSKFLVKFNIYDPWEDTNERYGHVHHYDERDLLVLFSKSNLKVIKSVSVPMPKRSKFVWEIFRLLFYPISLFSMNKMVQISGGFKIIFLESNNV